MGAGQSQANQQWWDNALVTGDAMGSWFRRFMRALPSSPRCAFCFAPFAGIGARIVRPAGFAPSRKNPRWCSRCFEEAPLGGAEARIGALFADIRGYTALAETAAPAEVAALLHRFYRVATDVLARSDAVIDKLSGDGLNAIFVPAFAGEAYLQKTLSSAEALLRAVGYGSPDGPWLALGVGLDVGVAFVGNVGSGEVKDFTALGDVVNTAARLQGEAAAGEMVISDRLYWEAASSYPDARSVTLTLKGKAEPVEARVVTIG